MNPIYSKIIKISLWLSYPLDDNQFIKLVDLLNNYKLKKTNESIITTNSSKITKDISSNKYDITAIIDKTSVLNYQKEYNIDPYYIKLDIQDLIKKLLKDNLYNIIITGIDSISMYY